MITMDAVDTFIQEKQGQQKLILRHLHNLLTDNPGVSPKLRFKIPFYYRKSWICYLNPVKNEGIELVFLRANELSNEQGLLESRGRKQVKGVIFYKLNEIPEQAIHEVVQEALLLDESIPYSSKRKKFR
ncbi:hypothetical protein OKW21_004914 [Catalinimonas alkaloidigena]|uniref:DUF1801 domain-containing protein n=1 Tax=Catalinimonas alkaloidigena TaxID=1075417 RepID=UPI002406B9F6|nr:DUF1801 domain-containing protein [Catalinimonas alkaloidigena]MDF9799651.1 hypothetical protein [Catalinimonas alkaloidigena]